MLDSLLSLSSVYFGRPTRVSIPVPSSLAKDCSRSPRTPCGCCCRQCIDRRRGNGVGIDTIPPRQVPANIGIRKILHLSCSNQGSKVYARHGIIQSSLSGGPGVIPSPLWSESDTIPRCVRDLLRLVVARYARVRAKD